ncbi:DNA_alkylation repair protein [Hexamita inflata]|uniref:DNA alkylation repair protein n=1 Tax=Hexamita inflata TaxID=28002 RepID=A0AA86P6X9_9EUKA|nr:DNA alkylation repair protein [Hexamita inflata]CAI9967307.1 DNA alkylation repair protein [Hexamita inflata]
MDQKAIEQLIKLSDNAKKQQLAGYFKSGEGQYGEGDKFLGITVPKVREVAKQYAQIQLQDLKILLEHEYHEVRLLAGLILVVKYEKSIDPKDQIVQFYLKYLKRFNNWDLIDLTCYKILGEQIVKSVEQRQILYKLIESDNLWEQRCAIVSTIALIRENQFDDIIKLSKLMLTHKHDLIHKAVGWMLREVGKRNKCVLTSFLDEFAGQMPRVMLRYSIEKYDSKERSKYMEM